VDQKFTHNKFKLRLFHSAFILRLLAMNIFICYIRQRVRQKRDYIHKEKKYTQQ